VTLCLEALSYLLIPLILKGFGPGTTAQSGKIARHPQLPRNQNAVTNGCGWRFLDLRERLLHRVMGPILGLRKPKKFASSAGFVGKGGNNIGVNN